jgi:hypothetical protein
MLVVPGVAVVMSSLSGAGVIAGTYPAGLMRARYARWWGSPGRHAAFRRVPPRSDRSQAAIPPAHFLMVHLVASAIEKEAHGNEPARIMCSTLAQTLSVRGTGRDFIPSPVSRSTGRMSAMCCIRDVCPSIVRGPSPLAPMPPATPPPTGHKLPTGCSCQRHAPLPREAILLSSRIHSTELPTAAQRSQSLALRLTVENAFWRNGT